MSDSLLKTFLQSRSLFGFFVKTTLFVYVSTCFAEEIPTVIDSNIQNQVYSEGNTQIPGLTWAGGKGEPEFIIEAQKNGKPAARVNGHFASKNAGTLLFSSPESLRRAQFTDDSGNFTVVIPLNHRKTPVRVQYIDDYGNKRAEDIEVVYENFYQFQLKQQTKKKLNFDGGFSFSYLQFTQSSASNSANVSINQIGLTPKFGVIYNVNDRLDVGGSIFGTLYGIPMSKEPDYLGTPRFYGVNMRVGYKVYGMRTGNIYLMTGAYFWGMLGTDANPPIDSGTGAPATGSVSNFGVERLSGPQLFLVGRFLTSSGRNAVGYLKAATILDGYGGITANREYAIGAAYQITPAKAKRRFMMNLDIASASFQVLSDSGTSQEINKITLNSYSLGISTSL